MLFIGSPDHPGKVLGRVKLGIFEFIYPSMIMAGLHREVYQCPQSLDEAFVEMEYLKLKLQNPFKQLHILRYGIVGEPITESLVGAWTHLTEDQFAAKLLGGEDMDYNPVTREAARRRLKEEQDAELRLYPVAVAARLTPPVPEPKPEVGVFGEKLPFWQEVGLAIGAIIGLKAITRKD
jgi:hypothetical protein